VEGWSGGARGDENGGRQAMAAGRVSVVFSFRNEEENIPALVERVTAVLAGEPEEYELVFVDDASTDRSHELLLAAREKNPRVKIVTLSRRFGPSEGVLAGLSMASGDAVVYMDSDLQDPPELISRLLEKWRAGADVVHTVRSRRLGESPLKVRLTRLAYRIIRRLADTELPVEAGDFKLLSRRAAQHLLALQESDPYIRGLAVWIGFRQESVAYERTRRSKGESKFPLFSRNPLKAFVAAVTSFSFVPIYAIAGLALAGLAAAGLLALAGLIAWAAGGSARGPLLLALAAFFWATLMGAVAVVGVYLARTYKDVRGRPRYIISRTIGFEERPKALPTADPEKAIRARSRARPKP
jgi:dolichol-phosphate mannosyltransferase